MDRRELLTQVLFHLESAIYLMDTCEARPDCQDEIYELVSVAQETAEDELNRILVANMESRFRKEIG